MFATATRNFVDEVDPGGLLIPMRSVNDSIALLTVVVSQKPFWFWQKPKHLPTDFTLNDLLAGDTPITPVLTETDFIKYNGTYGGHIQGSVDATFIQSNVNVEGKESSKLQMSFGSLKKDEVDVRRLLQDSKNRVLDMSHCLIQQTKKKCQVFGVVKERIVTNQPCSVVEELQQAGSCAGTFSLWGLKSPKMFATATRNFVDEVDPGGLLIPMRSVNDSIALLTVVVSQKPFWFWQKPKHLPTDFTLNDLLAGDTPITPVLTETDFIKYNGTYGGHIQGSVDATFIQSNVNVEGKESSKLQMSFGSLKKDEVDVRRLLQDSKNRVLDMSHCLIQQTKKKCQVFGVVKERIVTNQPCSVVEELQQAGSCAGTFSLWGLKSPKMFATATRNFVDEVDPGGLLIPMRSVNDSIALLTVVVSQKPFWFWQKPKHLPTDFTLNDLLAGDTPITPVLTETDFIKYNGTYGGHIQGSVDATFIQSNVNVEGKESSKLQMSFGSLKKDEVDVRRLLQDSKNRVLDMSHCLIQQTKKKCQVFGVVKERIVTNQPCSVVEELQQAGSCAGTFSLWGLKSPKVLLKDNASLGKDSNIAMEIPTNTTLAYALIDLVVKHDGRYELCLMSSEGGFEVDSPTQKNLAGVPGACGQDHPDGSHLPRELKNLGAHFQLLAALPASSRSSLLENITALMVDKAALNALQSVLDQMILGKSVNMVDVSEAHKQSIQPVLEVLKEAEGVSAAQMEGSVSVLSALHLITSALGELTCDNLAALRVCSCPDTLKVMDLLVKHLMESDESPASSADVAALPENVLPVMEHLFNTSGMSLQRDGDTARSQINQLKQPGNQPLIMCIALRGLHSLNPH